jgi:hypothetical protein
MTTNTPLPPVSTPTLPPDVCGESGPAGSLSDFCYELAREAINKVGMIPLEPISPLCEPGGTQENKRAPAGSPYLADWSMDTRPSYKLTDAEVIDKGRWQLESLRKREVLKRAMEVPTIYPEGGKS